MPKLHIANVIYGSEYIKTFLYTLKSQIINFEYLKKTSFSVIYKIYTTNTGKNTLLNQSIFNHIRSLVNIKFIQIDKFLKKSAHETMTACHNDIIINANKENAAIIFLASDIIISNNLFKTVCSSLSKGKRLLMGAALRLNKENFMQSIRPSELQNISPRDLIKKAIPHFHPLTYTFFWDYSKTISCWPAILCWKLDNNNILIRGFHLHPICIWPENTRVICKNTIDADYLNKSCPNENTWDILSNSDEGVLFELTTQKRNDLGPLSFQKLKILFHFVKDRLDYCHIHFAKTKIFLLSSNYEKSINWRKKIKQSDKIINYISKSYKKIFYRKYIWPIIKKYKAFLRYLDLKKPLIIKFSNFVKKIYIHIKNNYLKLHLIFKNFSILECIKKILKKFFPRLYFKLKIFKQKNKKKTLNEKL